jgi:hypothetical protein
MTLLVPGCAEETARRRLFGFGRLLGVSLALSQAACAATPITRVSDPLVSGEATWPEGVTKEAERADRVCRTREAKLLADYQAGKEEQQKFKTILGSITGAVGTAGGVIAGVGAYVIDSPDTSKTVSGVTGFVSGGLGAVGSVVTLVVNPGASQMESSSKALSGIQEKKTAARKSLEKDRARGPTPTRKPGPRRARSSKTSANRRFAAMKPRAVSGAARLAGWAPTPPSSRPWP